MNQFEKLNQFLFVFLTAMACSEVSAQRPPEGQYPANLSDTASSVIYMVKPGDCLWNIAKTNYKSGYQWPRIYEANRRVIKNPRLIYPRQALRLPGLVPLRQPASAETAKDDSLDVKAEDSVFAKSVKIPNGRISESLELEGTIIDETITKLGHDFFQIFYSNWQNPENFRNINVIIGDRPTRGLNTQVVIKIDDQEIYQQFLQPRYDAVEEEALYAIRVVQNYLQNIEEIKKGLQGGDMKGNGIY